MKISYEPGLVEEAVFLAAQGDAERVAERRRLIESAYDAADRDAAFGTATMTLFRRWGLAKVCEDALALAPLVERALIATSRTPGDEGADLLVGKERTSLLRVAPGSFRDLAALTRLLRHEVRHIADMLDPQFGYEPDLGVYGRTRAEINLVRERYRVLWNVAIDAVEESPVPAEVRRDHLARAFRALETRQRERLRSRFSEGGRRHAELLAAARDPWAFLDEPRSGPWPGMPCPLCGFPTHDWAKDAPRESIRCDFPDWEPGHGACGQCADMYRVAPS
jgi:hypothetical protein